MSNPILLKNYVAGAAIAPYRIVKFGAADGVIVQSAAATDFHIGVCSEVGPASNERCDAVQVGVAFVEAGAAITRGAALTSDASGRAIATTTVGHGVIGRAQESAAAAGDLIRVLLAPSVY